MSDLLPVTPARFRRLYDAFLRLREEHKALSERLVLLERVLSRFNSETAYEESLLEPTRE